MEGDPQFTETLQAHREAWEHRPLLRQLYNDWYARVEGQLAEVEGPTVELGSGIGAFKEFRPATVATDALPSPFADEVVDAEALPYRPASVANLVLIDVLHHVPRPRRFLEEAERVLRPGGRVVLLEPYCSPVSTWVYKRFHHELTDLSADPFGSAAVSSDAPFESNQSVATIAFWRRCDRFEALFPRLELRHRERLALLAYPLSGGFTKPPLLPAGAARPVLRLERALSFAAPVLAFRCLVTLQRRAVEQPPGPNMPA